MKIKNIFKVLPLLAVLAACQSEEFQQSMAPKRLLTVKASLPASGESRALIPYGYQDTAREVFQWYGGSNEMPADYITLFNITNFADNHLDVNKETPVLEVDEINGKQATFTSISDYPDFSVKTGDILLAVLSFCTPANIEATRENLGNAVSFQAGSYLYDQKIVEDPDTNILALRHVHMMMHMYDIVKVEEDGVIPELHLKHLSALFRVTLRNETGKNLFDDVSELVFEYPTGDDCVFIYGFNYLSVAGNETEGFYLKENFKAPEKRHPLNPTPPDSTVTHSYKATHRINQPSNISPGIPLENGKTYELYAVVTPRIGPTLTGNEFTINLYNNGAESGYGKFESCVKYSITIDNFNIPIEAGKRYWFNLTAVNEEEGGPKLMFTRDWLAKHPDQAENQGE